MSRIFKNGIINKLMNENKNNISREILIPVFNLIKNKKYDEALNLLDNLFNQVKENSFIDKTKGLIYLKKKRLDKIT
tara:strand:- start:151 stop:381 length:231 start_codon:yes stop_codon:yes gene_type:complete